MKTMFTRNKKTITNVETGESKTFASINQAKRESHHLQKLHCSGRIGCGIIKVVH